MTTRALDLYIINFFGACLICLLCSALDIIFFLWQYRKFSCFSFVNKHHQKFAVRSGECFHIATCLSSIAEGIWTWYLSIFLLYYFRHCRDFKNQTSDIQSSPPESFPVSKNKGVFGNKTQQPEASLFWNRRTPLTRRKTCPHTLAAEWQFPPRSLCIIMFGMCRTAV